MSAAAAIFIVALSATLALPQQPDPDQLLKSAIEEQQHGDYPSAIRDYRKVLELRPNIIEAKVNLAAALVHVGQYDTAIAMYREVLPALSFKNPVLLNLGLAYYKKGDFKNASEQFDALHRAQPADVRVVVLLGDSYLHLAQPADALALLEPLAAPNSQNLDFDYVLGSALIKAGRRRDGIPLIEKVAESSKSGDAYLLAGSTLMQINEFDQALKDLEAALRLDAKLPGIYTVLGTARDKTGDVKWAEAAFREALKTNADDFDANLYLGAILCKRRDLDEARPYLERAVRLNPGSSMARYEMAMLKSTSGQYEAAAEDLEKVVKDDPEWLEPHVELASLYYRLHRAEDGRKERQVVDRITAEQQEKGPGKP
jgi:tetratricopeptide (TPR) repeat protein